MGVPGSANFLLAGAQGYQIERSLRFNSADSAYLNRTFAAAGNRQTWTWSGWIKRSKLGTNQNIFGQIYYSHPTNRQGYLGFGSSNTLIYVDYTDTAYTVELNTSQVFRDVSAWYHIVCTFDTTNATSGDRVRLYVNGTRITTFGTATYPSQNYQGWLNADAGSGVQCGIGRVVPYNTTEYFDGYLTEVHFIDGQALTPSSFGETDTITGVWKPKRYTGTYGTNGFYLKFADNSGTTSTTLGKDSSGNGNNWTPNNFSVTAGAGNDSLIDTPTPYADGGNGRGNYATLNPLRLVGSNGSLTNGNLENSGGGNPARAFPSTIAVSTGKFYAEFTPASNNYAQVGAVDSTLFPYSSGAVRGSGAITWELSTPGSVYYVNSASGSGSPPSPAGGDVIMVAIDATTRKVWFGRNGTWNGSGDPAAGTNEIGTLSGTDAISFFVRAESTTITANFGQRPFAYTPPSGFLALNTQNLPEPSIKKPNQWMDINLATGNNSTQTITNAGGFQPDLVWMKIRSASENHILYDSARGTDNFLVPNLTNAAASGGGQGLTSFNSNGFTLGSINPNYSGSPTFVAWQWKESATPGFDIVTYTGTGSARTIAHSLGVAPQFIIVKNRSNGTANWQTGSAYHNATSPWNYYMRLNTTAAAVAASTIWNNTAPTSSVFSVGTDGEVNANGDNYVAYLWSEVAGFSKFGSYTGNGSSDGPFVFCGFRPKFVLFKSSSVSNTDWMIFDGTRNTYNVVGLRLDANSSAQEADNSAYYTDFLSNGFKLRGTSGNYNSSGGTYIFAAWAESPAKYSLAR